MQRVVSLNLRRYPRDPVPGTRYLSKFSSKFSFFDRKSDFTYDMPGNSNCTSNRQLYVISPLRILAVPCSFEVLESTERTTRVSTPVLYTGSPISTRTFAGEAQNTGIANNCRHLLLNLNLVP